VTFNSSRRDFLTRFIKPVTKAAAQAEENSPALPDGVNILLKTELCIAWGRGICDRCERVCAENAILFVGMMNPKILEARCTLCNLCAPVCPVDAIEVRPEAIPELHLEVIPEEEVNES